MHSITYKLYHNKWSFVADVKSIAQTLFADDAPKFTTFFLALIPVTFQFYQQINLILPQQATANSVGRGNHDGHNIVRSHIHMCSTADV